MSFSLTILVWKSEAFGLFGVVNGDAGSAKQTTSQQPLKAEYGLEIKGIDTQNTQHTHTHVTQ